MITEYDECRRISSKQGLQLYLMAFNHKIVPISLTILSTILGLVPFLYDGPEEVFWFAFAMAAISGTAFSILALIIYLPYSCPWGRGSQREVCMIMEPGMYVVMSAPTSRHSDTEYRRLHRLLRVGWLKYAKLISRNTMPKQKISLIVLMTSLLIAAACSRSDVRDLTREDGTIPNDSIIKSVEFLYLHDDEQTMLGGISSVDSFDGKWYVLDNSNRSIIVMYDAEGRPLNRYDRTGRGPGEYAEITDCDIDPATGRIYVLCGPPKIIILDSELNFIQEIPLTQFYHRIAYDNDGILLFSGYDAAVDRMAGDGSVKRIFETAKDAYYTDSRAPVFIRSGHDIYFQTESSDSLYRITHTGCEVAAAYDYMNREEAQARHRTESLIGFKAMEYVRPKVLCVTRDGDNLSFIYNRIVYNVSMEYNGEYHNFALNIAGLSMPSP